MSWWSQTYNRPLKDPILQTYTLEELIYEYNEYNERKASIEISLEQEADKIEEAKEQKAHDWADEMEKEDILIEAAKAKAKADKAVKEQSDPREDPKNLEWMEKEIQKAKEKHGDDFGEDIKMDFND